ncbi:hypothetical protein F4780DRAFT_611614 [Xylariomycetidae sp. FL0641]|nr:hypothetical protein F4780DRAFT_611614 [Xylariomycetidae sp. FL0641]
MQRFVPWLGLGLLLGLLPGCAVAARPKDAILLSDVESLTLRAGAKTKARRVSAIPQLRCVSDPKICALHEVDVMRCANQGAGYDAEDVQWSCAASLPPELKLGATDVLCEGYAGPDDPFVLKGSCGVEYRLLLTEAGEHRFPDLANGGGGGWGDWFGGGGDKGRPVGGDQDSGGISGTLFGVIFLAVCCWILYGAFCAAQQNRRPRAPGGPRRPRFGGGGGGGGGFGPGFGGGGFGGFDDDDDPPPPYPGTKPSSSSQSQQGWRPGFWSGVGAGAAAGYLAGGRGGNNRQDSRNYGSGWGAGPSRSSPSFGSSSSSSGSTSSARYESTGFGSTNRR